MDLEKECTQARIDHIKAVEEYTLALNSGDKAATLTSWGEVLRTRERCLALDKWAANEE